MRFRSRPALLSVALLLVSLPACEDYPEVVRVPRTVPSQGPASDAGPVAEPGPQTSLNLGDGSMGAESGIVDGAPEAYCGDGRLTVGEECDDANKVSGDGCSDACRLESNSTCPTPGAACETCGNGVRESSETCDDGNLLSNDGCDSTCHVEPTWVCDPSGKSCRKCGNGAIEEGESCDDGNGALEYVECVADDVKPGQWTSFPQSVDLQPDETVVFAWITYESREHRDRVNEQVMKDPRIAKQEPANWPFDGKRMIFGGFQAIVQE